MVLSLLLLFPVFQGSVCGCRSAVFRSSCWMRRFPGVLIDLPLSGGRGANLLIDYSAKSARQCGSYCCLRHHGTCNMAIFNFAQGQGNSNCFHLNCPSQESCIMRRQAGFILLNVTKGEDPDLLIFGKGRSKGRESGFRSSANISRFNHSEYLGLDKQRLYSSSVSLPAQAPLPTSNRDRPASLPPQTTLPSPLTPAVGTDFQNNPSGTNSSRISSTGPPDAPAFAEGEVTRGSAPQVIELPTRPWTTAFAEGSAHVTASSNLLPLNPANPTAGSSGKNSNIGGTTAPLGSEALLTSWLIVSLIILSCVYPLLWVAAWSRRKRGDYGPLQQAGTG
ncbi:MANSC domain-containing protein 4-like [Scyliorhinus canicula]|uniref:MANSC domain-containing protein 4-like n=1 Tax=Scyliorhinus canicula TaxID=7830 RepID=UPI0018F39F41|nr:MANSC domain-containing protein 4-like [Scyliorhinus canicula]